MMCHPWVPRIESLNKGSSDALSNDNARLRIVKHRKHCVCGGNIWQSIVKTHLLTVCISHHPL